MKRLQQQSLSWLSVISIILLIASFIPKNALANDPSSQSCWTQKTIPEPSPPIGSCNVYVTGLRAQSYPEGCLAVQKTIANSNPSGAIPIANLDQNYFGWSWPLYNEGLPEGVVGCYVFDNHVRGPGFQGSSVSVGCYHDEPQFAIGLCGCNSEEEQVGSQCLPFCRNDQIRDEGGTCVCPTGQREDNGQCVPQCRADQIDLGSGNCVCPIGQVESGGMCTFPEAIEQPDGDEPPADEDPDGGIISGGGGENPPPGPECRADQVEIPGEFDGEISCDCPDGEVEIDGMCQIPPEYECTIKDHNCEPVQEARCLVPQTFASAEGAGFQIGTLGHKRYDSLCLSVPYKDHSIDIAFSYDSNYLDISRARSWLGEGWTMSHQQELNPVETNPARKVIKNDPDDRLLYYRLSTGEEYPFVNTTTLGLWYYPVGINKDHANVHIQLGNGTINPSSSGATYFVVFKNKDFEAYDGVFSGIKASCKKATGTCIVYQYDESSARPKLTGIGIRDFGTIDDFADINTAYTNLKREFRIGYTDVNGEIKLNSIDEITASIPAEERRSALVLYNIDANISGFAFSDGPTDNSTFRQVEFAYDSESRLTRVTAANETGHDNRNASNPQLNLSITSTYDSNDRVITNNWGSKDGSTVLASQIINYDNNSMTATTSEAGVALASMKLDVDADGRVTKRYVPNSTSIGTATIYCSSQATQAGCGGKLNRNNPASITYPNGTVVSYQYNARGQVTQINQTGVDGPIAQSIVAEPNLADETPVVLGTAASTDQDGDGLSDAQEAAMGTDPLNPDSDNDGLTDGQEQQIGSNPLAIDSDGDGIADNDELAQQRSPVSNENALMILLLDK